jgi:hypothetical protein
VNLGIGEVAKVFLSSTLRSTPASNAGSKKELSQSSLAAMGGFKSIAEEAVSPSSATSAAATCGSNSALQDNMSTRTDPNAPDKDDKRQEELILKLKVCTVFCVYAASYLNVTCSVSRSTGRCCYTTLLTCALSSPQVTLIEFLTCSKLLLQKARSALIDGNRSAPNDAGVTSTGLGLSTSLSTNSLNPNSLNRSSLNSSAATTGSSQTTNRASLNGPGPVNPDREVLDREREQYHNWQREMELAFRNMLRQMKPYFADWHDSDVLQALQRDMNDSG